MSGFPLQYNILNASVTIFIAVLTPDRIYRKFSLHGTRLECIRSHIIQLVPLEEILLNELSVKKDHRDACAAGKINNFRRCCSIYKIHTQDITVIIDHLLNLIILDRLIFGGTVHIDRNFRASLRLLRKHILIKALHQLSEEGIILIIERNPDPYFRRSLIYRSIGGTARHHPCRGKKAEHTTDIFTTQRFFHRYFPSYCTIGNKMFWFSSRKRFSLCTTL